MEHSGCGSVLMLMTGRRMYLPAGIVGLVCAVVGVFESYRLYHLISEELQGHCDFVPCANLGTYLSLAAFVVLTIFGGALLSAALLRQQKPRS